MAVEANPLKALFLAALEKAPGERAAFLDQACAGDGVLRQRVEALMRAHDEPDSLLDQPAVEQLVENMETTPPAVPDSGPPLPAGEGVVRALGSGLPRVQLREPEGDTISKDDSAGSADAALAEARELPARYQMAGEIARGGMGAVLRGRDTELGREIAVKVLLETHQGRTELVQRFVDEAQIAGQLQHPGIAPIYDMGTSSGKRPYFTMKLVKGQTLAKLLAERGDPGQDRPRLLKVFEQVCQTLAYAHARGVIHRDLKPANIMVGAFGEVQVMDWGLAKVLVSPHPPATSSKEGEGEPKSIIFPLSPRWERGVGGEGHTQAGTALGTPAYMAPEQARGEVDRVDERADVFGLGALLCEILTGKPPFLGNSSEAMRKAQTADLADAYRRVDSSSADDELLALAKRCLATEPDDRPRNAGEVAGSMAAYLESVEARLRQAELERAQAQVKAAEERKRRKLTLALAASVLVTVLLGGGGFAWSQQQRAARRAETARKVDEALERAALQRGRAAAAVVGDLTGWVEAQAEAGRAADLLAQTEADNPLRQRVEAMQVELKRDRDDAERRARDAEAERRLLARLEAIRGEYGERFDARRADRDYAEAFRVFGVDPDAMKSEEIGARLKGRPGSAEIVASLDEWCILLRIDLAKVKGVRSLRLLRKAAQAADPDPWRNQLRVVFGQSRAEATITLETLANDANALRKQPAASLVLLASLLKRIGKRERSATVLRLAWQRFPSDFWINFLLGMSSWSRDYPERSEEAVCFLTAAIAARPGSVVAYSNLGIALSRQGKLEEAIAVYRQAIALDPLLAAIHINLGVALSRQGNVKEAIDAYRRAIALDPQSGVAHSNLGNILTRHGKVEEAVASCREAVKLDPTYAAAHHNLGLALVRQRKVDEAIACFHRAIKLDPQCTQAHYNLGTTLGTLGKTEEAITALRQAIALDPLSAQAHHNLGNALSQQGKVEEAVACYRQAIQLDPKDASARYNLGNALYKQEKLEEAIACYRRAIQFNPKRAEAHCNLGHCLSSQGQLAESLDCFRRGHALGSKRPGWPYPSALWVRRAERLVLQEKKLLDVLSGKLKPASAAERIEYVGVCTMTKRYEASTRLYADAFAADPTLADNSLANHRYNAACCAALAACGKGADTAKVDEKDRVRLRGQALAWLRADLMLRGKQCETAKAADRAAVQATMRYWQKDSDLADVRDKQMLVKLPEKEREGWQRLWTDVEALRKKAQPKAAPK